jgi:protein required for attachment to host cells
VHGIGCEKDEDYMKKKTWVIVANSALARIFEVESNQHLLELEILEHPESRLHDGDLVSSAPGRAFESKGPTRHAYESATTPKTNEINFFARSLCTRLQEAHSKNQFDTLYIIAAPAFLGVLRECLSPVISKIVVAEINKDFTSFETTAIREHLPYLI